jgi:hypothetical protein
MRLSERITMADKAIMADLQLGEPLEMNQLMCGFCRMMCGSSTPTNSWRPGDPPPKLLSRLDRLF